MNKRLDRWTGEFGDEYAERNEIDNDLIESRMNLYNGLFQSIGRVPKDILEIGAGNGQNMMAIGNVINMYSSMRQGMITDNVSLFALEPNDAARERMKINCPLVNIHKGTIFDTGYDDNSMEFVFTSGVLIHIHPEDLDRAISEMYRVSSKYIFLMEYFAPECEEIKYRGEEGLLWRNDFGGMFLDKFKMRVVGYGFAWKRITKLDNLTWWLLEKTH